MYRISFKQRPYHMVVRDMLTKRVVARTRMRHVCPRDATRQFEAAARQLRFSSNNSENPVRLELYTGPASARCNKRLLAMAGDFKPPVMVEEFGNLSYLDLINAAHADRAHLTQRWSDTFIAEKRHDIDPLHGKSVLELDPRNAEFDGSVLNDIPVNPTFPSMGTSVVRQQLMAGHVSQTAEEHRGEVRKILTEGEVDPAPKRTGPIRMMGEAEGIVGIPAPRLSDDVVSALMAMSEPHPTELPLLFLSPSEIDEQKKLTIRRNRSDRLLNFVNHQLHPFGIVMSMIPDEAKVKEMVHQHLFDKNDRLKFDEAYEQWLAQRDRDVEIASDHAASNAGMWDKLKEGNVGFKPGQMVLLTAHRNPNAPRKSMLGINIATADKIRHNCEDPKALQRRTMLVHADPEKKPE